MHTSLSGRTENLKVVVIVEQTLKFETFLHSGIFLLTGLSSIIFIPTARLWKRLVVGKHPHSFNVEQITFFSNLINLSATWEPADTEPNGKETKQPYWLC